MKVLINSISFLFVQVFTLASISASPSLINPKDSCSYQEYLDEVDTFIDLASRGEDSVKAIAGAFAALHLVSPGKYLWPGMASYAQSGFVDAVLSSPLTTGYVRLQAIEATHEVFTTGYTPLYIYTIAGLEEVERLYRDCHGRGVDLEAVEGIRLIDEGVALADAGRQAEAVAKYIAGNKILLAREHAVLQSAFYDYDLGILGHALSTFACVNFSHRPEELKCFAAAFPFSRFENQSKRTSWNTEVLLPSFVENYHSQDSKFQEIVAVGRGAGGRYPDF